ncbi:hypothetical protein PV762_16770 [Mitsuaria sp. CC2]|uniref:hypothetical protein n=1 Tax=Mitsuaria sp. CC2 TaxID=3029186 RepID=UPI003B8DA008
MTPVQHAWESLSNTMRVYVETRLGFERLRRIDQEEAINNVDRALEAKLEKFHALYDVTKNLSGFDYFAHGDTSLVVALRNAIHHRDHDLFISWNALLGLNDGMTRLAGAAFLLGSTTPESDALTTRFYFRLQDFYDRLSMPKAQTKIQNPAKLKSMWDAELMFADIHAKGKAERYPVKQVYVDVMPAFMTAVSRVSKWLAATDFRPTGYDGKTYFEHFRALELAKELDFKELRVPAWSALPKETPAA